MGLSEVGTHAIVDAALGPYSTGETTLARGVLRSLTPGMLCLADRNFYSGALWGEAAAAGAELLWRGKSDLTLVREQTFDDGSWLATTGARDARRRGRSHTVRVIDYRLDDPGRPGQDGYRMLTTIVDPDAAPAAELAGAYPERWELETALAELTTHQRGPRMVLRSKQPDGVYQEAYAYLCVHYAIRTLMHDAALAAELTRTDYRSPAACGSRAAPPGPHPGFSP